MITNQATGKTEDHLGNRVNAAGYLIDDHGNIVNKKGEIKFYFWELLFQEPPKIFSFTEFSIEWIKGRLDRDVTKNPKHNDEFDLDGRRINTLGYLIDDSGNIVDKHGKEVFKREVLTQAYGQDAQIPYVFRSGILSTPRDWDEVKNRSPSASVQKQKSYAAIPAKQSMFEQTGIRTDDPATSVGGG